MQRQERDRPFPAAPLRGPHRRGGAPAVCAMAPPRPLPRADRRLERRPLRRHPPTARRRRLRRQLRIGDATKTAEVVQGGLTRTDSDKVG